MKSTKPSLLNRRGFLSASIAAAATGAAYHALDFVGDEERQNTSSLGNGLYNKLPALGPDKAQQIGADVEADLNLYRSAIAAGTSGATYAAVREIKQISRKAAAVASSLTTTGGVIGAAFPAAGKVADFYLGSNAVNNLREKYDLPQDLAENLQEVLHYKIQTHIGSLNILLPFFGTTAVAPVTEKIVDRWDPEVS